MCPQLNAIVQTNYEIFVNSLYNQSLRFWSKVVKFWSRWVESDLKGDGGYPVNYDGRPVER